MLSNAGRIPPRCSGTYCIHNGPRLQMAIMQPKNKSSIRVGGNAAMHHGRSNTPSPLLSNKTAVGAVLLPSEGKNSDGQQNRIAMQIMQYRCAVPQVFLSIAFLGLFVFRKCVKLITVVNIYCADEMCCWSNWTNFRFSWKNTLLIYYSINRFIVKWIIFLWKKKAHN